MTGWINRCKDRKELRELVEQRGESFNAIHVTAAWGKLAVAKGADGTGDEEAVVQRLQVMLRAKMQEVEARGVVSLFVSMSKLKEGGKKGVDDELVGALKARALATAGNFEPQHVVDLIQALTRMGITDPDAALVAAMQGRAAATAGDFKPQEVTYLVEALSKMGSRPDAGLVEAMQGRATATAGDFTHRQVVDLMWSLAKMGITPDGDLAKAMQAFATAKARYFNPFQIGNFLQTLIKMGAKPEAGLVEAMQQRATATAREFKPQEFSTLLDALSKMGITPDAGLVAARQARAPEKAGGNIEKSTPVGEAGDEKEKTNAPPADPGQFVRQLKGCSDTGGLLRLTLNS